MSADIRRTTIAASLVLMAIMPTRAEVGGRASGAAASQAPLVENARALDRPEAALAERWPVRAACADALIVIGGGVKGDRELACSGAHRAIEFFGRCGVSLRKPVRLEITDQIHHPFGGHVLGFFNVRDEKVLVRSSQRIAAIVSNTPFAAVPPREFYLSIVVHEVVHGILGQNSEGHMLSPTADEYLAYALQIEAFSEHARRTFLLSFPGSGSTADLLFSEVMLSLDPQLFAARAYQHFKVSEDRCGLVRALLNGEANFIGATY